jgi:hypothetical protein
LPRKIFKPKGEKVRRRWLDAHLLFKNNVRVINGMSGACRTHVRREMHIQFSSENVNSRDSFEDLDVDVRMMIKK